MRHNLTGYLFSITASLGSGSLLFGQETVDQEVKSTRIVVKEDSFEQIRKRVAEQLEKASVSEEVREKVLQEIDSISLNASKARSKATEMMKDAKTRLEQKLKVTDGKEQVEVLIEDGGDPSERAMNRIGNIFRAQVSRDLDQRYRIGVACSSSAGEENASSTGLTIMSVVPDSPAFKAGIKEDDVLIAIDGNEVKSVEQLSKSVQAAGKDGKELVLKIQRDSKELEIKLKPAEIKDTDKLVESLQLDIPPSGFVFRNQEMLDQLKSRIAGQNLAGGGVFAFSGNDELKKEIELMRKEIQELKEMIKELKSK
ncbi:MAG: PDZ domain-containing protein [Pirellula sp.]|nr:PDZ domain-containing protein [Pirellula sp.]